MMYNYNNAIQLFTGSRETCDIEGEDFTVDKIPNTRCFNCICKVIIINITSNNYVRNSKKKSP